LVRIPDKPAKLKATCYPAVISPIGGDTVTKNMGYATQKAVTGRAQGCCLSGFRPRALLYLVHRKFMGLCEK